ncbi:DUF4998 domain-containing protein [uncultured Chitinophaga sp.]|uniref:DUF4998 domain-containing protein n=1 Tax=uncultured Chitinophaga sp. TaxID=339340 RepID=UPI0025D5C82D|nr:DUF4998 domain-containing protein [uncultured Chitinophaga sp.]
MKWITYIAILLVTAVACNKTDEDYRDFAPGGEIVYAGKPDSLKVFPGKKRIQLRWLLTSDASITTSRIYWNRGRDSAEVFIKRTAGVDTVTVMLDNMAEGPYTFTVYNYNNLKNRSIKTEINGDVYGAFYESTLLNRLLKTKTKVGTTLKLDWQDADPRAIGVELFYKDLDGADKTWYVPVAEKTTILDIIPLNNTLDYHTLYKPQAVAIDTFRSAKVTVNF